MTAPSPPPPAPRHHLPALGALEVRVREAAENRPGVYRFLGPRGEVLYVGKSVRIRDRLLAWLRAREGKGLEILRVAREVAWAYAPNEFEAVLEEFLAIREHRPRFNVVHRRSRRFAWVRLTGEAAPRLVATLNPGSGVTRRGGRREERLFGPFPARKDLPRVLVELSRTLGLRDCPAGTPIHFADQPDLLGGLLPPVRAPLCPRAEMGSCPGPCAALCSEATYREGVEAAVAFLEGRSDLPLERLEMRMAQASRESAFETAARLRDRRDRLEALRDRLVTATRELHALSFVYHPPGEGARIHLVREGRLLGSLDAPKDAGARSRAGKEMRRLLRRPAPPPGALDEGDREALFLVLNWFRVHPAERKHTTPIERWLDPRGSIPSTEEPDSEASRPPGGGSVPDQDRVSPRAAPASG
jgi:excinuclease ABC subunit C